MKYKKLLLIPVALMIASCAPTSEPTSNPTTDPTSAPTSEEPVAKKIDVIVLAGQSNMEGHSWSNELKKHISEEKYNEYVKGYEDFRMCYKVGCGGSNNNSNNQFVKIKLGQGCNVPMFGPELGIAEYLTEYKSVLANEVAFVKFAVGGTTIYNQWRSPSSVDENFEKGYIYTPFIKYVENSIETLVNEGYEPTIRAICWMQGESDGASFASFYEELEDNFINDVVNDLAQFNKEDKIKFVDAGIYDANWVPNFRLINNSKIKNANKDSENRFYFDTIKQKLEYKNEPEGNPDLCHFDSTSMIELGRLFATTLVENQII